MRDSYETRRGRAGRDSPNGYRARIDVESDDVLHDVLEAVAAVEGVPQTELPELYSTLDPDRLDGLLRTARTPLSVTFRYSDSRVELTSEGVVTVEPRRN